MPIKWDPPEIKELDKEIEELGNEKGRLIIHLDDLDYFKGVITMYDHIESKIAKLLLNDDAVFEIGEYKGIEVWAGYVLIPGHFLLIRK